MDRILLSRDQFGLTLIELLVALLILGITLLVAAPTMQGLIHGSRLRAEAARLAGAINLARSEAIIRNSPVSLCPSSMAESGQADCIGNYAGGWIVFSNVNADSKVDAGSDQVIRAFAAIPAAYSLSNRSGTRAITATITYQPDGSARRNLTLQVCAPDGQIAPWSVVLNRVGRARLTRGEGECPLTPA